MMIIKNCCKQIPSPDMLFINFNISFGKYKKDYKIIMEIGDSVEFTVKYCPFCGKKFEIREVLIDEHIN